jgi:predicted enzyme related to lactoylglutathione lyase
MSQVGSNAASAQCGGETGMVDYFGRFVWYELITTDITAAKDFYREVVGWTAHDASSPNLAYTFFASGSASVGGLMDLPAEARKMGATPRWMGYVAVTSADATADRIKRLGGAVYVPPTDSNIGRVSVVADPQAATFGLIEGLKLVPSQAAKPGEPEQVGWHELLADNWEKVFSFYGDTFGWRKAYAETGPTETYQLFAADGQTIGGMFNKRPIEPVPYWLNYFNTDDLDAAADRVKRAGGRIMEGPLEVPGGNWIARCRDCQGAAFALEGKRRDGASEVSWSTEWDGFTSKGRLLKPRR